MIILVTGGAGFIGSHLCDELIKQGETVLCLDNFNNYYSPKRKFQNIVHNLEKENFTLIEADITNQEQLESIFQNHQITKIVHLAARAGVRFSIENPHLYTQVNVAGTVNLLELARQHNVANFIFGSSSSVYGENEKIPFNETDVVDFPISPYAASKKAAELYCHTYSKLYNLNVTCLRFFTVYGPRGRPDMAPYLFTEKIANEKEIKMFGDGTSKRDYTYVSDIVEGIIAALKQNFKFEIINLGNSQPIVLKDFIATIENSVGKKAIINNLPMQLGDVPITYADVSKAKRLLNYQPKVGIEEGISKFVEWFKGEKSNE